ncbi:hypothetical protein [Geodermatophilus ruber]|uniref:Uncharacterized protein n=1 Tax=Geodermatophilus ruber TaxID=504800 RepID=A0A1I4G037_9ACTN|nr:hypothetical protein [Geodermatophilus ruber]SFL23465.1 hypothetical protein SAMN04488085_10888 [Geodermatophilus ruber]
MSPHSLGGGLLQLLRPEPVTVPALRRAIDDLLPDLAVQGLRLAVRDDRADGPVVELEEGERRVRVPLHDLAEDMTDARVPSTPEGIAAALSTWVDSRPVPDATAADCGVAVLDWTDRTETAVGWQVVVRRGALALPWTPSPGADPGAVDRIRTAATERAGAVGGVLRVEGLVALWSHPEVPLLASAALAAPEQLLARIATAGLDVPDLHVVVTPRSPVACASSGVAARLAGESGEPCLRLPWRQLTRLRWI